MVIINLLRIRNIEYLSIIHEAVDLAPGYDCIIRVSKDAIISIIMALDVKVSKRNSRFNDLFIEHSGESVYVWRNCITLTNCNYTCSFVYLFVVRQGIWHGWHIILCRNPLYVRSISVKPLTFSRLFITEYFKIDVALLFHY